jgi:hypothetical protein
MTRLRLLEIAGDAFDFPVAVTDRLQPAPPIELFGAVFRRPIDLGPARPRLRKRPLGGWGKDTGLRCLAFEVRAFEVRAFDLRSRFRWT